MLETLAPIFDNVTVLRVHSLLGFALLALFFLYAFSKKDATNAAAKSSPPVRFAPSSCFCRDESARLFYGGRGWGLANPTRALNIAQLVYTSVLLTADIAILILRHRKNF